MRFSKWHGIGNDFVIVNGFCSSFGDLKAAAVKICDRNFGIGADGLIVVMPSDAADFQMRIINSDGSEPEMCGNGIRCFARYVYESKLTTKVDLEVETLAGIIRPSLVVEQGRVLAVRVDMGQPRLLRKEIPMTGMPDERAVNVSLAVGECKYDVTCISMGNPHCVIFMPDVEGIDIRELGRPIEAHSMFPRKTNVEFVQVVDRRTLRMRVWERGAGITLACGTGACAAAVAAILNGKTERRVDILLDGGKLEIEWGTDNHVYMTGPAVEVFRGEYL